MTRQYYWILIYLPCICFMTQGITIVIIFSSFMQQNPILFETQCAPSTVMKETKEVIISRTPPLYKLGAMLISWSTGH